MTDEIKCTHFRWPILILDHPNKNGVVYTKEVIEKSLENMPKDGFVLMYDTLDGYVTSGGGMTKHVIGQSNEFKIEDDKLVAHHVIIYDKVKELFEHNLVNIRPIGEGNVNADGTISNYKILATTIVLKK